MYGDHVQVGFADERQKSFKSDVSVSPTSSLEIIVKSTGSAFLYSANVCRLRLLLQTQARVHAHTDRLTD